MIINKNLLKRDVAGETVLIPVGKTVLESRGMFALNEVGSFLWDLLPQAEGAADLTAAVLREYEVAEEEARRDIEEFLERLEKMGII